MVPLFPASTSLLTADAVWPAATCSCLHAFPSTTGYTSKLWDRTNTFLVVSVRNLLQPGASDEYGVANVFSLLHIFLISSWPCQGSWAQHHLLLAQASQGLFCSQSQPISKGLSLQVLLLLKMSCLISYQQPSFGPSGIVLHSPASCSSDGKSVGNILRKKNHFLAWFKDCLWVLLHNSSFS